MATQTPAPTKLEKLLESFDQDPAGGRIRIRELLEAEPRSFKEGIVRVAQSSHSCSRGIRFAVGLLAAADLILPTLCDPFLNLEGAIFVLRTALQADPMMDVTLAKNLADATARGEPVKNVGRLMDVLGEISTGNRITSSLMRLWRSSDPHIRSKAALLIGRGNRSIQWAKSRMAELDPRIRANAVEALWGLDTDEAKTLLRAARRDGDNRVAANALVALYLMGDTLAISELFQMATWDSPKFRSSAAWAMGETGDPRFCETLGRMMGESDASVRKRAFAQLSRLRAIAKTRQVREWRAAGRLLPGSEPMRQLSFDAIPADGSEPPRLLPTQFILREEGRPVTEYRVEACPPPASMAVTFFFPYGADTTASPWVQGAIRRLSWKRPSDLWCATFYLPAGERAQDMSNPPQFTEDGIAAKAALREAPAMSGCPAFWDGIRASVQTANPLVEGGSHLIVYNQSSPAAPQDLAEIVSAAAASNTTVQVVSLAPFPPLEELCRGAPGSFRLAKSEQELSRLVEEAHMTLLPRFLVSFAPTAPGARELSIRVFDATGWGETTLLL